MKTEINIYDCPRAKIGWDYIGALAEHIGKSGLDILFAYSFPTSELLITDDRLIGILKAMNISYVLTPPSTAIKFIKGLDEGDK